MQLYDIALVIQLQLITIILLAGLVWTYKPSVFVLSYHLE